MHKLYVLLLLMRFFLLIILLIPCKSSGQNSKNSFQDIQVLKQARLDTMASLIRITSADTVADIGSGKGYNLVRLSTYFPSVRYYVEDIDSSVCNPRTFGQTIMDFNPALSVDSFVFYYGTTGSTGLPKNYFTKVLLIAVVHEFDEKETMFADIKSIVKPGGFIFIEEPLVIKPGLKDKDCNNPYLTEQQLRGILAASGLEIAEEKYIQDAGNIKYRKIFKCRVKDKP